MKGTLNERVAQAIADRVNQPGQCSYQQMASAAIPVVIEECARVIEQWENDDTPRTYLDLIAAIRALKDANERQSQN